MGKKKCKKRSKKNPPTRFRQDMCCTTVPSDRGSDSPLSADRPPPTGFSQLAVGRQTCRTPVKQPLSHDRNPCRTPVELPLSHASWLSNPSRRGSVGRQNPCLNPVGNPVVVAVVAVDAERLGEMPRAERHAVASTHNTRGGGSKGRLLYLRGRLSLRNTTHG